MATPFHGWAYIDEGNGTYRELFNHARTAAYLQNRGCRKVYNVLADGGCEAYRWGPVAEPLVDEVDGSILVDEVTGEWLYEGDGSPLGWMEQTFVDPISDDAPWYNPSFPESGDALGFWITEWTGLDSGVIQRQVTNVGAYRGGGVFGAMGSTSREMGLEVILIGETEAAIDYLYRWLDATISSVCATCASDTILIRRICPDVDPLDLDTVLNGVVELREVGLISGMTWGSPPIERDSCFMRTVNFTLGAMDPCMYGFCTGVEETQAMDWDACFAAASLSPDRSECRPSCSEMSGVCRTAFDYTVNDPSASAPVIVLTAPTGVAASFPMRIRTYANPYGLAPADLCGAPLLGELYVSNLPPWSELRYDVAGRRIEFRNAASGGWINGFAYIEPNDVGVPRFFSLGCGDFTTIIEPADFCFDVAPSDDYELEAVSVSTQVRMNCA